MAGLSYPNLNYLFYSCTNLVSVSGLGNLSDARSSQNMLASARAILPVPVPAPYLALARFALLPVPPATRQGSRTSRRSAGSAWLLPSPLPSRTGT